MKDRAKYSKFILFFFIFFLPCLKGDLFAVTKIDSLEAALKTEHEIEKKAQLYLDLGFEYKSSDLHNAEKNVYQALALLSNSDNKDLKGSAYALLGDIAYLQDSLNKAETAYREAIPLLSDAGNYHRLIAVYLTLGNRYIEKANYPEAMNNYLKGITYSEENNDSTYIPNLYNNLGVVYLDMNNRKKALEYYTKALGAFENFGDTNNVAGTTTNIGSIYIELNDYDIARGYYQRGLELFTKMKYVPGQAHALFKLGLLDKMQGRYDSALQNLFRSKKLQETTNLRIPGSKSMFLAETNINIGIVYYFLDKPTPAKEYLTKGFSVAKDAGQYDLIALSSQFLSKLNQEKGDFEKALDYYTLYKTYSDSTYNEENVRKLTQMEMQYQFDAKMKESEMERKVEVQKRKRLNIILISVMFGLILTIIIAILMLKLERNKKKKVEIEQDRLRDQLEHTNKELTTYVMYLLRKNEFILTIIEKLKKARLAAKPENKKVMAELINELKLNTDTVSWNEFEVRFQQVHTDFYNRLSRQFPDLTNNEIRMCAFFKLNMTSKEIAALTYQSLNSIKVARYRLRKKLKLAKDDNLVSFLARF